MGGIDNFERPIEDDERPNESNDREDSLLSVVIDEAVNTENTKSKLDVQHAVRHYAIPSINKYGTESAIIRFFATAEMVEMAVLRLPIRDILLRVPRVCKNWKEMVEIFPSVQQALFFRSVQGSKLGYWESKVNSAVAFWAENQNDQWVYTVFVNPFYSSFQKQREKDLTDRQRAAAQRPRASWRRRRTCQPEVVLSASTEQSRTNRQYVSGQWTAIDKWRKTTETRLVELLESEKNGFLTF